jgi:hypothetical protein
MSVITVICAVIGMFLYHEHTLYTRARNDVLYSHAPLTPISRAQLQTYRTSGRDLAVDRLITKTVEDIYLGVVSTASENMINKGYWHSLKPHTMRTDFLSASPYSAEIVSRVKRLFPECDVEYSSSLDSVGVFWYDPTIYVGATVATAAGPSAGPNNTQPTTTVIPAAPF